MSTRTPSISIDVSAPRPPRIRIGVIGLRRDSVKEMSVVWSGIFRNPCWIASACSMLTTGSAAISSEVTRFALPVAESSTSGVRSATTVISSTATASGWRSKLTIFVSSGVTRTFSWRKRA